MLRPQAPRPQALRPRARARALHPLPRLLRLQRGNHGLSSHNHHTPHVNKMARHILVSR